MCSQISSPLDSDGPQLNTSVPTRLPGGRNATAEKLLVAASELMIERGWGAYAMDAFFVSY